MTKFKKKNLFSILFFLLANLAFGQSNDVNRFGYKGKILSATVSNYTKWNSFSFDKNGTIGSVFTDYSEIKGGYTATITKRTKNGFTGTSTFGNFTLTLSGNHISSISFKDDDKTLSRTFTYDKAGNLIKINETYIYYTTDNIEYGANLTGVDNYYNEINKAANDYYNEINKAANDYYNDLMRNPYNYNSSANKARNRINRNANRAANRINKAARNVGVNSYSRVKKTKHTEKASATFSNYVYDEFGNWISRKYVDNSNYSNTQLQDIQYEPDFWSKEMWERVKATGNLRLIEDFALNSLCTATYKKIASDYWNDNILSEVSRKDNNHPDSLIHVASSKIINAVNKETALNLAQKSIFENEVMPIRDYVKVEQTKYINRFGIDVFNQDYREIIDARSNQLKADSIQFLTSQSQHFFDSKDYEKALSSSTIINAIDPTNTFALNMMQEAAYQNILVKELNNSTKEEDYETYLNAYDYSPHIKDIEDRRALYASSLFGKETANEELERVIKLPAHETNTIKTVKKRYKKWMFKNNRGKFLYVGIEGETSFGKVNSLLGVGVTFSLGYTCNVLNFVTGFKYNRLMNTSHIFESPKEPGQAFFERQYFTVPVMLRFNILNGYRGNTYLSAGVELNAVNLTSKLNDVEDIKDDKFAHRGLSISPRVAFGGRIGPLELELFATYDVDNPFDVDYIKSYRVNDQPIESLCDPKAYDKQVNADGFMDKVRAGLALRFVF